MIHPLVNFETLTIIVNVIPKKAAPATLIPRTENSFGAKLFNELTNILHFSSAFPHQIIFIKFNFFFFHFEERKKEKSLTM